MNEVYLQRMVYGFGDAALARPEQAIYQGDYAEGEAIIAEARAPSRQAGWDTACAGALSPRESILERVPDQEPWRACSRPLRLAYITAQGNALPCCIAPFTDAPYESIVLGNYLQDGIDAVWQGAAYARFRERLYSSDPPASCHNCGMAWSL